MKTQMCSDHRIRRARGGTLVMSLVCLMIVATIVISMLQAVGQERRLLRNLVNKQQCRWLAESGVERAVDGLNKSKEYRGETWQIEPAQLGGSSGVVEVELVADGENPTRFQVRCRASYPSDASLPSRYTHMATIEVRRQAP